MFYRFHVPFYRSQFLTYVQYVHPCMISFSTSLTKHLTLSPYLPSSLSHLIYIFIYLPFYHFLPLYPSSYLSIFLSFPLFFSPVSLSQSFSLAPPELATFWCHVMELRHGHCHDPTYSCVSNNETTYLLQD